jgi:signal peptidase I
MSGPAEGPTGPAAEPANEREQDQMATRAPDEPRSALSAVLGAVTEVVVVVAMALAISLVVKTFLIQAFFIPSGSMENTLLEDDRVIVTKLTPGPFALDRGDIVVFKDPGGWLPAPVAPQEGSVRHAMRAVFTFVGLLPHDSGEHLIKRVIGLPGDTVACCDDTGRVTVNGVAIDEPYLFPGNVPSLRTFSRTVPTGDLWVMGDHREISEDSRVHGVVPRDDVVGRAFVLVWPLNRATGLGRPEDVFAKVPAAAGGP